MANTRHSVDASIVNRPRLIGGMPWQAAVGSVAFFFYTAAQVRNWYLLIFAVLVLLFLSGAGRRDPLFLKVYLKHRLQAERYSPTPVSCPAQRQRRPLGYGRYDWQ